MRCWNRERFFSKSRSMRCWNREPFIPKTRSKRSWIRERFFSKSRSMLFCNWQRFIPKSRSMRCWNRERFFSKSRSIRCWNRDRLFSKSRLTILKGPFSNREDFDDDFSIFSMSRSWLTFEIENTKIENAENGFFSECTFRRIYYTILRYK